MCIKNQLFSIQDKQEENKRALIEHKRFVEQFETFQQREVHLFGWLQDAWGKDKEIRVSLEHDRLELQYEQRKIAQKLHDNKQILNKEKLNLLNAEKEELTRLRRLKIREEKS